VRGGVVSLEVDEAEFVGDDAVGVFGGSNSLRASSH
jgi:hypothetical protein